MRLGVVRESGTGERRVAIAPGSIAKLAKYGFEVVVEGGAGNAAGFSDTDYSEAGATIVDASTAWQCPLVAKVEPPTATEVPKLKSGAIVISLVYPARNEALLEQLAKSNITTIALDKIPRISRAQKMDVLSSMANIAGYRAVLEAAAALGGFMGAQVTAAGTEAPARVLVIGAGVAGLASIAAGRALGAEVRAFDTRAATKEQVESLGGKFLELEFEESGEGQGGYAKVMSKEFIDAEMQLFREQAREVDIVITTALVPGTKAPVLFPQDVLECLKPGSVVVDLAASQGGNCAMTQADKVVEHNGIKIIGYTDLPSRMAGTASRFFSANIAHLLDDMCPKSDEGARAFQLDLDDEVVRAATLTHGGELLPPPPPPEPSPQAAPAPKEDAVVAAPEPEKPKSNAIPTLLGLALIGGLLWMGSVAPSDFIQHFTVFVLACFVGWQVVWNVAPALHTPLMSVTNAISGIIIVGGMLQAGTGDMGSPTAILGAVAILVATINIFGGFAVTQRMLKMFKKEAA